MKRIKSWRLSLGWQILLGLVIGIILGACFYENIKFITFATNLGDAFINLISMVVLPIVMSSLIVGIANMGDLRKLGRIGVKTLIYFEILSTIAFIIGMVISNLAHLGSMVDLNQLTKTDISTYLKTAKTTHANLGSVLMSIIPTNIFASLGNNDMLPVVFFSSIFGLGLASIGKKGQVVIDFLNAVSATMFKITGWVMHVAPLGVAGLIGATVAKLGLASLKPLSLFILMAYATMIFFILVILGITSRLFGFKITEQLLVVKDELILAFTTASSEVTLPRLMDKSVKLGVDQSIGAFVIPTGYTFNLDGSAIYQGLAVIFVAQAYHINLSLSQQLTLLFVLMLTSKGMAGTPGASFVVLLATVGTVGIPTSGIALIAGIDRLVDMGRTVVNVIGNMTATLVIGKSENEFNQATHDRYVASFKK